MLFNNIWEKGNGTSLWAAREYLCQDDQPFLVLMSDHIFHPEALHRLLITAVETSDSLLCTDASFDPDIDIDDVVPEASLIEDLGADSLTIVELVMSMEEVFEIEIDDDDAEKLITVKDAIDYIKAKS